MAGHERIPEADTFQFTVVLEVLTQQQGCPELLGDRPLHGIPEGKVVLLDSPHGKPQATSSGGDDWEQRLPVVDLSCRLGDGQLSLASNRMEELAEGLQGEERAIALRCQTNDLASLTLKLSSVCVNGIE